MKFTRIHLDENVSKRLNNLKGKTGLPQNILCRIGLMLSLREDTIPNLHKYNQNGLELRRDVLLGEDEPIIISLVKQKAYYDKINTKDESLIMEYFLAHLNRGAEMLCSRVSSLKDIAELILKFNKTFVRSLHSL